MTPQEIEDFYAEIREVCERLKIDLEKINQQKIRKGKQDARISIMVDTDGYARFNVICYDKKGYTEITNQSRISNGKPWNKNSLTVDEDWEVRKE